MFSKTTDSRASVTYGGCLKTHRFDQFLDAWGGTYTRPPSSTKTPSPKQRQDSVSPFLTESPRLSFWLCSLCLSSVNSVLPSSRFAFPSRKIDFHSGRSQRPSSLVLWDSLWVLGLSQPALKGPDILFLDKIWPTWSMTLGSEGYTLKMK